MHRSVPGGSRAFLETGFVRESQLSDSMFARTFATLLPTWPLVNLQCMTTWSFPVILSPDASIHTSITKEQTEGVMEAAGEGAVEEAGLTVPDEPLQLQWETTEEAAGVGRGGGTSAHGVGEQPPARAADPTTRTRVRREFTEVRQWSAPPLSTVDAPRAMQTGKVEDVLEQLFVFLATDRSFSEVSRLVVVSRNWRSRFEVHARNSLKTATQRVDLSSCHSISAGGMEEILQYVSEKCSGVKEVDVTA